MSYDTLKDKMHGSEIYNMDKLLKNVNLYKVLGREIPTFIERRNFWIVGRPGVGKSYMCRMLYEKNLFMKSINKSVLYELLLLLNYFQL